MAAGIFIMGQAQEMVKPGQRKFHQDDQGYKQPMVTTGAGGSEHVPTPIPSAFTFRGDVNMNSHGSTSRDNSATLPLVDNESEEDLQTSSSGERQARQLNSIVINI